METAAWRGAEVLDVKKKRAAAWGADAQQLMQMMMGQLGQSEPADVKLPAAELSTLDLLGRADPCSSAKQLGSELLFSSTPDFLELDPEEPLPSGWEKCLDLKVGFHHLQCTSYWVDVWLAIIVQSVQLRIITAFSSGVSRFVACCVTDCFLSFLFHVIRLGRCIM